MTTAERGSLHPALVCPDCRGPLDDASETGVRCPACHHDFPVAAGGVPILLSRDSAFDAEAMAAGRDTYHAHMAGESRRKQRFRRWLPGLATDLQADDADQLVNRRIAEPSDDGAPVAGLVIGAGFRVAEYADRFPQVSWLVSDTEATFGAGVVGDATSLPVADGSQGVVLCEHVLEHVVDPLAAAREIERVLRPGGTAMIKVPFNYPWHGAFIDFFRFTPAGYLAAFRRLETVHVGHGPGPASTITYALQGAFLSLFTGRLSRRVAVVLGRLVFGPWRKLDRVLVTRNGSLGSSCSLIFIGTRVERARTTPEVIAEAKALGLAPVVGPADRTLV
ncbi:MAG: methyltransferase domain-containing protein [Iamia sp.]